MFDRLQKLLEALAEALIPTGQRPVPVPVPVRTRRPGHGHPEAR